MNQIYINITKKLVFLILVTATLLQVACKKESSSGAGKDKGAPTIKGLRAISPKPNDSTLHVAGPGQYVVIRGTNLAYTKAIYFNGYQATFNAALFSDTTMVVQIPADMPFASLDQAKLNTIEVVTTSGDVVFKFPIVPPPPIISAMSNESAVAGTSVTIYGNNFFYIDKVVFPGGVAASSGIVSNTSGTTLTVTVPSGVTTGGTIKVVNRYGTGTSVLLFNDFITGVLLNYDNVNNFAWGAGSSNSSTAYPGNRGTYGVMSASAVGASDLGWWNGNRSINTNSAQWVSSANLSSSLDTYALKFEISVTKAWSGGSIYIVKDYDWTYLAVYNPWKNTDGTVTNFTTNGWLTVTIPLSSFKTKANNLDGTGDSAPSLSKLLGSGSGGINFMFVNNGITAVSSFEAAIDNIRIEKVK